MKKKLFFIIPALLSLFISSCGGGGNEQAPASQSSSQQTSNTPASSVDSRESSSSSSSVEVIEQYTITFKDEEDKVLESKKWDKGTVPSYNYVKNDTAEWDYTVQGWAASLGGPVISVPAASADATYWAVVSKVKNKYTITFESNGGSSVAAITEDYGTSIQEPEKPTKENYKFVAWSYDAGGNQKVTWPITLTKNEKLYANWNEVINIKAYLKTLMDAVGHDPYSYIPDTMEPTNSDNHVTASSINYDFTEFNNVSAIKYGGFGEQWHMVIENIQESERFYSVLSLGEAAINASVALFNNYLDSNPDDTATHTLKETAYTAKLDFSNNVLSYTIQYKTNLNIPLFGEVLPQIDMTYNIATLEKAVRIQLSENNAMRYVVTDNSYVFGLEYGLSAVSRKAYLQINRLQDESVQGHIYEYVQYKDKDLVPACADFYINDEYTSVVGNKASGMPGFTGYINELYKTSEGKLLGYEVRETFTKWGVTATYHTLWFNLNNISGITNVKAIKNNETTFGLGANNNHDIYLNNSASIFEPTYNTKLVVKTSRKYDVEMRKQYFYGYNEGQFTEYEVQLPMMFIQADHDGYTNFSDFPSDIQSKSGITASVNLSSTYLAKIQNDYATLVDIFIAHKDSVTGEAIANYIGDAIVIA